MKSASLGRKTNPNELDYFDKPLPDEPEKSNKRSALNRGKKLSNFSVKNFVHQIKLSFFEIFLALNRDKVLF